MHRSRTKGWQMPFDILRKILKEISKYWHLFLHTLINLLVSFKAEGLMRVLIAEDEPDICYTYKIALESRSHEAVISQDGNESIEIYRREFLTSQHYNQNSDQHGGLGNNIIKHNIVENNIKAGGRANTSADTVRLSTETGSSRHHIYSPFDAVVLDYRIPGKDGLYVAKEILELNPEQRIIFASAYVKETLEDSVKKLGTVVELIQKPFDADVLVDTIEDKEAQEGVKILMRNLIHTNKRTENKSNNNDYGDYHYDDDDINQHDDHGYEEDKEFEPSLDQLADLFEGLRRIQKGRTF
jgi:CheY-like chemotaxis protein